MASLEAEMLAHVRRGLDHHAKTCPLAPRAILLNPGNFELFGWEELWGVPVLPDDRVAPKRFRIDCDGSAFGIEEEVAQEIRASEPLVVPAYPGPPRHGKPIDDAQRQGTRAERSISGPLTLPTQN
jgi:hypothetical protein